MILKQASIFLLYLFFIGGYLLSNTMLVPAIYQHESATGIHVFQDGEHVKCFKSMYLAGAFSFSRLSQPALIPLVSHAWAE